MMIRLLTTIIKWTRAGADIMTLCVRTGRRFTAFLSQLPCVFRLLNQGRCFLAFFRLSCQHFSALFVAFRIILRIISALNDLQRNIFLPPSFSIF